MPEVETISIADLRLDGDNPRHDPAQSQRDAVAALVHDGGAKLLRLAEDIAANGLSPLEALLVVKATGSAYTVVEGNRRIAAVKLLGNPELAPDPKYKRRFAEIARRMGAPIHAVPCLIVGSKDEAKHWLELRHTGERGGAGIVPWSSAAIQRFQNRRGSQADRGMVVLDAVAAAYPHNPTLQSHIREVRAQRLTTFGRLVSDPHFRDATGMELDGGTMTSHYKSEVLEPAIERVLSDLTGAVTVTHLKTKDMRRGYVDRIRDVLPPAAAYEGDARALVPAGTPVPAAPRPKPKPKVAPPSTTVLFATVELTALGGKVAAILGELKRLNLDEYPYAAASLLRVVLELATGRVAEAKGWPQDKLRANVKKCLTLVDPTGRDPRFQGVRTGIQDGNSGLAAATIQGYLHNPDFHPTPSELRALSANYSAFLAALDGLV